MRDPVRAGLEEVEVLGNPRVLGIGVWGYLDRVLKSSIAVCPVSWDYAGQAGSFSTWRISGGWWMMKRDVRMYASRMSNIKHKTDQ